jgi:hypothetical protein
MSGAGVRGNQAPVAAIVERKRRLPGRIGTEAARRSASSPQESTGAATIPEKPAGFFALNGEATE